MNEFEPLKNVKDEVVIVGQKQQETQLKHVASLNPHKGHTVFEVNLKEKWIAPAEFEPQEADYKKASNGNKSEGLGIMDFKNGAKRLVLEGLKPNRTKLIRKPDCIYISALNKINVIKKLEKMGVIKIIRKNDKSKI